jgi:beta-galactosidase/beta-glucuronidase
MLVSASSSLKAHQYSLMDPQIQGESYFYLDNNPISPHSSHLNEWQLKTEEVNLPALVPGDLLSDLLRNNHLEEPYFENNFQNTSFCDGRVFEYSLTFDYEAGNYSDQSNTEILLVLDGIKMGAEIHLNKQYLETTTDQFLRYRISIGHLLKKKKNILQVIFKSDILTDGRFMACTGGWDWAPFSSCPRTKDTNSLVFSRGITKSIYLVRVSSAAITAIIPQTFYKGEYPTTALEDGNHAGFELQVRVHLWAPSQVRGSLEVEGCWGTKTSQTIEWNGGDTTSTLSVMADAKDIKLWWPVGVGPDRTELSKRSLYTLKVRFIPLDKTPRDPLLSTPNQIQDSRRIGFRHFALVTGTDTDPMWVQNATGQEGTDFAGLYFRVNGMLNHHCKTDV